MPTLRFVVIARAERLEAIQRFQNLKRLMALLDCFEFATQILAMTIDSKFEKTKIIQCKFELRMPTI